MKFLKNRRRRLSRPGRGIGRRLVFEGLENRNLLTLVIEPGSWMLLPDAPDQAVPISVTRSSPDTDPPVTGFNLRAELRNGQQPGTGPRFQDVDFSGGIWEAYPHTTLGGPVPADERFAQASVLFNSPGQAVAAEGLVVTLIISTVGVPSGRFELRLADTAIGADSHFIGGQGVPIPATIAAGTIDVSASPWQNPRDRFDVNADTRVTPLDALLVINDLNARGTRELPVPPQPPEVPPPYLDVNGDGYCTPLDALQVINRLNEPVPAVSLPAEALASTPAVQAEAEPPLLVPADLPPADPHRSSHDLLPWRDPRPWSGGSLVGPSNSHRPAAERAVAPGLETERSPSETSSTAGRPKPDEAADRLSSGELEHDLDPSELAICLLADAGFSYQPTGSGSGTTGVAQPDQ